VALGNRTAGVKSLRVKPAASFAFRASRFGIRQFAPRLAPIGPDDFCNGAYSMPLLPHCARNGLDPKPTGGIGAGRFAPKRRLDLVLIHLFTFDKRGVVLRLHTVRRPGTSDLIIGAR
jgi:hypothetical protein